MSDKRIDVLKMIAEDMRNDAKRFEGKPFFEVFDKRFTELGRFTPAISKSL